MHIHGVDLVVVDDGPQPRAGEGHLRRGVLPLEVVDVQGAGQGVLAEVRQAQQRREGHTPHAAPQGPLLGVEAVGPIRCRVSYLSRS